MLYVALGDKSGWKDFSVPKPIVEWEARSKGGSGIDFKIPDTTWNVEKSCYLTHWYVLDETKSRALRKESLGRTLHASKGGTITIQNIGFAIYAYDDYDNRPYLR